MFPEVTPESDPITFTLSPTIGLAEPKTIFPFAVFNTGLVAFVVLSINAISLLDKLITS
ncbi:hypothetical protein SDC9_206846 [bioreactor metagenome]|uniref:Uncharacterized protein n=1 Tax=bioreactor metagenome TaxID=1076179 RepID=A0A645J6V2_9ZZZZ